MLLVLLLMLVFCMLFNCTILVYWCFVFVNVLLVDVKKIKNAYGVMLNDVVMVLCLIMLCCYFDEWVVFFDELFVVMVLVLICMGSEIEMY